MTARVTERVKIPLCASAVVSFCHIREAANKLTHFLFDGALLSSTRLLNSPTRQPDADHICTLYAFHITAHLQERFFPLGWVAEYFYYKPGSIYNETVCICYQLPAATRLGVTFHSWLNKHLFGWSSEHLLSLDLVLLRCEQGWMNLLAPRFHKHANTAFWGVSVATVGQELFLIKLNSALTRL